MGRGVWAEIETHDYRTVLEANLVAPFHLARTAAPYMIESNRGRIIMMTSLAGDFAMPAFATHDCVRLRQNAWGFSRIVQAALQLRQLPFCFFNKPMDEDA